MKESHYKKSLIFGIIILFVGASIVPNITGLVVKTNNQLTKEPTTFPLNPDYTNGFWKFDENSGSIAYDSTPHNYDGTINGATWTAGYSGSALLFDGVDDYVNLDAYALGLGFNKTDDLVFSFYFKTSMYSLGRIFSISQNYGTNPEFQIFLAPNGTIAFKVIVLSCGFTLYTNNSFNNNAWHYVEIIYNGITSEPTVTIKVDNSVEATITHWVCAFYNDEFAKAKIGRKSYEATDYFNGKIDEFKITKYPGGNEQDPPTIIGPTYGEVGVNYCFDFVANDPEGDAVSYYIDWGDGTITDWFGPYPSGQEVSKCHKWYYNGSYDIRARSMDVWHYSSWGHHLMAIGNVPPFAPNVTGPDHGEIGQTLSFKVKATDYDNDQVYYYFDWGDGTNSGWFGPYNSGQEATNSHSWDAKGDYEITAQVKDFPGNLGPWSDPPIDVRIGDVAPNKPTITGKSQGGQGVEYDFTFKSIDPEGDSVWYEVEWGEKPNVSWAGPYNSGFEVTFSKSWVNRGTFTIKARAKDKYGKVSDYGTFLFKVPINMPINQQRSQQFYGSLFLKNFQRLLNLQ